MAVAKRRDVGIVGLGVGLLVVLVASVAFAARFEQPGRHASGDTYWYAMQAQEFAGVPTARAEREASLLICRHLSHHANQAPPSPENCTYSERTRGTSPRYIAIFTSRPLWPLLLSPMIALLGLTNAVILASALGAVVAALAVYMMLGRLGLTSFGAGVGGIAVALLPTGHWSAMLLPEGAVLALLVIATYMAARVAQGALRHLTLLIPAMVALYACKPANGAALAGALLLAGLVLLPLRRGRRSALTLFGIGAAGLLGSAVVTHVLNLPSLTETVQDMATRHFVRPDVPNPLSLLYHANVSLWTQRLGHFLGVPWPFAVVVPAMAITLLALRRAGIVIAAVSLAGVSIVVAHPLVSEYDRLISSIWLVVAAGMAVATDFVLRRRIAHGQSSSRTAWVPGTTEPEAVPAWAGRTLLRGAD